MCRFRQSAAVEELQCFLHSHLNNGAPNRFPSAQIKCVSPARIMLPDHTVSGFGEEIASCASNNNKPSETVDSSSKSIIEVRASKRKVANNKKFCWFWSILFLIAQLEWRWHSGCSKEQDNRPPPARLGIIYQTQSLNHPQIQKLLWLNWPLTVSRSVIRRTTDHRPPTQNQRENTQQGLKIMWE